MPISTERLEVLENPDRISRAVLDRGLDAQTAFEIVSIDIADIDVGENVGARLQAGQVEADTRVARATAEQRRAEAVATKQAISEFFISPAASHMIWARMTKRCVAILDRFIFSSS